MKQREVKHTFYRMKNQISAILYEPVTDADLKQSKQIAILVMHSDGDYLTFPMGVEMAKRGYYVLCANVRDKYSGLDRKIEDVGIAMNFLREYPGIRKIILMGHSGGGTLLSAYQSLAENGPDIFRGPEKIVKCRETLVGLPRADGLMLLDSNFGNGAMALFSLDPAVTDETSGLMLNKELDLFHPENGFKPGGSTYSDDFIRSFFYGQHSRHNRLLEAALERLEAIELKVGCFLDDEPFIVPGMEQGFMNNKLYAQDIRLMSHTRKPWPLLHADGSVTGQVIVSVRRPVNDESLTASFHHGALRTTVRSFLSSYAIRTNPQYGYGEDYVSGIDWDSSYNCPPGNIRSVTAPLLVMGMTAGWEYLASETIFENASSRDKSLLFVEGANHLFQTAKNCESFPGEFGDTAKTTYDYVDKWLSSKGRFIE